MIHPTAIVHPSARIDSTANIGPYVVIDEHVELGPGCQVGPHAYLTGHTTIGANNVIHAGAVIGNVPQDLKYRGAPSRLRIGQGNVFREQVTVHCANDLEEDTVIGDGSLFMANVHIAHNVHIGNNVILANGVLLAGHVTLQDRVFLSGHCLVHQFVRIGKLAMMQGGSKVSKDVPPFTIVRDTNIICGLNVIGMRRHGYDSAARLELRKVYHELFRSKKKLDAALATARDLYHGEGAQLMIDFVASTKRGVCADVGKGSVDDESQALE
jgi:UDP-N-acetylglucosamine acyltransferase